MSKKYELEKLIGKEIVCGCGRTHKSNLEKLDIGQGAAKRIPGYIKEWGYKKIFLVADKKTWLIAGLAAVEELEQADIVFEKLILDYDEPVPDEHVLGEILVACPNDTDLILAVGSGTLNDLCKFVSYQMKINYIVFATAPSMDGFASVGAPLIVNHVKITYDAPEARAVIGDIDILAKAPMDMITAGLGDTLGKYTCLLDWKLSHLINDEYYCEDVVNMVRDSVETVVEQSSRIKDRDPEAVKAVTEALVLTGVAMSYIGNSRPASGCEHHISHYWEMKFLMEDKKPALHGTKVGVGMIMAVKLYHMLAEEDIDFAGAMKKGFDYEAWEEKMKECYGEAASGIISLEQKCHKNDIEGRNRRIRIMQKNWKQIQQMIKTDLPKAGEMEKLFASLGAPVSPAQINIPPKMVEEGIIVAKELRNRYTLWQILWDLGLSEKYAKEMIKYFEFDKE